jgi:hypothetical protein
MPDASAVLIVVDVQNSFMPGGSLAVPRGDEVVPVIIHRVCSCGEKGLGLLPQMLASRSQAKGLGSDCMARGDRGDVIGQVSGRE